MDNALEATLEGIWTGDKLERFADAELIHRFIDGQLQLRENAGLPRTFVLNLDSDWGSGKSYFLTRFQKELTARGHVAVYVNAWEDDHSDDPFLTVVTAIIESLEQVALNDGVVGTILEKTKPLRKSAGKIVATTVFAAGKHLAKRYVGQEALELISGHVGDVDEPSDVADAISKANDTLIDQVSGALLETFSAQKTAHTSFSKTLAALSEAVFVDSKNTAPVYVLIDELDRCRPAYAVEMLERIKHLFSVENFVFVLGTDTAQLSHAVRGLYGGEFDGTRYLNRFVDRTYKFKSAPLNAFIQQTFDRLGLRDATFTLPHEVTPVGFLEIMFQADGIELRDIEQMMEVISTFVAVWPWENLQIDLISLLPLVHRKHLKVPNGEEYRAPMMEYQLKFDSFTTTDGAHYTLEKMSHSLWQRSTRATEPVKARDMFGQWLNKKNLLEKDCWRRLNTGPSILEHYPILLETVARLD
jgi:hypothetical protein